MYSCNGVQDSSNGTSDVTFRIKYPIQFTEDYIADIFTSYDSFDKADWISYEDIQFKIPYYYFYYGFVENCTNAATFSSFNDTTYYIKDSCSPYNDTYYIFYIALYYGSAHYNYTGWGPEQLPSYGFSFVEKEDVICYEDRVLVKFGQKYLCGYEDIWPVSGSCQLAQQLTDNKTIVGASLGPESCSISSTETQDFFFSVVYPDYTERLRVYRELLYYFPYLFKLGTGCPIGTVQKVEGSSWGQIYCLIEGYLRVKPPSDFGDNFCTSEGKLDIAAPTSVDDGIMIEEILYSCNGVQESSNGTSDVTFTIKYPLQFTEEYIADIFKSYDSFDTADWIKYYELNCVFGYYWFDKENLACVKYDIVRLYINISCDALEEKSHAYHLIDSDKNQSATLLPESCYSDNDYDNITSASYLLTQPDHDIFNYFDWFGYVLKWKAADQYDYKICPKDRIYVKESGGCISYEHVTFQARIVMESCDDVEYFIKEMTLNESYVYYVADSCSFDSSSSKATFYIGVELYGSLTSSQFFSQNYFAIEDLDVLREWDPACPEGKDLRVLWNEYSCVSLTLHKLDLEGTDFEADCSAPSLLFIESGLEMFTKEEQFIVVEYAGSCDTLFLGVLSNSKSDFEGKVNSSGIGTFTTVSEEEVWCTDDTWTFIYNNLKCAYIPPQNIYVMVQFDTDICDYSEAAKAAVAEAAFYDYDHHVIKTTCLPGTFFGSTIKIQFDDIIITDDVEAFLDTLVGLGDTITVIGKIELEEEEICPDEEKYFIPSNYTCAGIDTAFIFIQANQSSCADWRYKDFDVYSDAVSTTLIAGSCSDVDGLATFYLSAVFSEHDTSALIVAQLADSSRVYQATVRDEVICPERDPFAEIDGVWGCPYFVLVQITTSFASNYEYLNIEGFYINGTAYDAPSPTMVVGAFYLPTAADSDDVLVSGLANFLFTTEKVAPADVLCTDVVYLYSSDTRACDLLNCPAGTYVLDEESCQDCPVGTYSKVRGALECTNCPYGTTYTTASDSDTYCIGMEISYTGWFVTGDSGNNKITCTVYTSVLVDPSNLTVEWKDQSGNIMDKEASAPVDLLYDFVKTDYVTTVYDSHDSTNITATVTYANQPFTKPVFVELYGLLCDRERIVIAASEYFRSYKVLRAPPEGFSVSTTWYFSGGNMSSAITVRTRDDGDWWEMSLYSSDTYTALTGEYTAHVDYKNTTSQEILLSSNCTVVLIVQGILSIEEEVKLLEELTARTSCVIVSEEPITIFDIDWYINSGLVPHIPRVRREILSQNLTDLDYYVTVAGVSADNISVADHGELQCGVQFGDIATISDVCEVIVLGILEDPSDVIAALGAEFLFSCQVTMPPYPVIAWEKDGVLVDHLEYQEITPWMDNEVSKNGQGIMLATITFPSSNKSDEGRYRCKVTWQEDGFPIASGTRYSDYAQLSLLGVTSLSPTDPERFVGEDVTFVCTADYDYGAVFTWYFRGFRLSSTVSAGTQISTTEVESTYALSDLDLMDVGTYMCSVEYEVGTSAEYSDLYVMESCADLVTRDNMALTCKTTDRANVRCLVTCDEGYSYGAYTPAYECSDGIWDHYSMRNPTNRISPCQQMSAPSTKTLNIIYTVPSLAPGICEYFPNVACALQDLLSNLDCVSSGDCEVDTDSLSCGPGSEATGTESMLTFTYSVMQVNNVDDDAVYVLLQEEAATLFADYTFNYMISDC